MNTKNRLLAKQLDGYLKLNPLKLNTIFSKYGISENTPINVETVVEAYQYFGSLFATDIFNAIYPEIKASMEKPKFSNVDPSTITTDAEVVEKNNFWDGFANVLNGLVAALPAVTDSITQIKYGNQNQQLPPNQQYQPVGQQPQGFNNSILIYLGVGFVALLALIIVFKKMK